MAQLAEQLICNQQVTGSSPVIGFDLKYGWVPEWPKGADCKSVVDDFEGSNPSPSIGEIQIKYSIAGWSSLEARRAHNRSVQGSSPRRSILAQWLSWLERRPVTAEVVGSSPIWVVSFFITK